MSKSSRRTYRRVLFFLLALGCGPVLAFSQNLVDITANLPASFPTDNSAYLVGDESLHPDFFWIKNNALSAFQVGPQGGFTPLTFANASQLPSTLSPLVLGTRSYWGAILVFWGYQDHTLSLWAITDRSKGFELDQLQSLPGTPQGFPAFWVVPYGRFGWLIVWQDSNGLEGVFNTFSGTTTNLGTLAAVSGTVQGVQLVERPDLDSQQGDLIWQTQNGTQSTFQTLHMDKFQLGSPTTLWQTTASNGPSAFAAFSLGSENHYLFTAVAGSQFATVTVDNQQVGQVATKDFGVPLSLSEKTAINTPQAVVLSETSGTRFWWQAVGPQFSTDQFRQGLLPGVGAPVPLFCGPKGAWLYLSTLVAGPTAGQNTLGFIECSPNAVDTTQTQVVASSGFFWELGENPEVGSLITVPATGTPLLLEYSNSLMAWEDPTSTTALTDPNVKLRQTLLQKIGQPLAQGHWQVWGYRVLDPLYPAPWVEEDPAFRTDGQTVLIAKQVQ